jgi:DNA-binding NarL/FixJ family response regulator
VNPRSPIRVVVGEDQPLFREGVVQALRGAGLDVVAATGDACDLVRKTQAHAPDLAIVDIEMPPNLGDDGLQAAKEIRAADPHVSVLVLSHYLEDRYVADLLADRPEGVGYLLKGRVTEIEDFVDAVRRVAHGGSVIDPEVVARLVGRRRGADPLGGLTPREHEVLGLMAQGRSNRGIAEVLVVTDSAVERHVTNIFSKLELRRDDGGHRRVLAVLRHLGLGAGSIDPVGVEGFTPPPPPARYASRPGLTPASGR